MFYKKTVVCCLLLLFAGFSSVDAATTSKGQSGLINIPSAYVLRNGHGGIGYFNVQNGDSFAGNISLLSNVELSYSHWRLNGQNDKNLYGFKIALAQEEFLKPAISIGVEDLSDDLDRSFYIVTSKQFPWGLRSHIGLKGGSESNGLFYGLEKEIRLTRNYMDAKSFIPVVNIMIEYDGQHFNYGAYIRSSRGLRFDIGWYDDTFRTGIQLEF